MLLSIFIILTTTLILSQLKQDKSFEALAPIYTDSQSRFYKWKGISVHFKDEGQGIPIILLHGTSASLHTWDKLTTYLKDHVRIIRVDLPGFGLTGPHPERDYSLNAYLQFLDVFTEYIEVSQCIITGNSWGGLLAWYYAAQRQQKVKGLILIDAAGYPMSTIPKRFLACRYMLGRWILRTAMSRWLIKIGLREVYAVSGLIDHSLVTRYMDLSLRAGNRQAFLDFMHKRERPDLKLLQHIYAPALILWGRLDNLYSVERAFAFKENISKAKVAIIENTGHVPMEEAPDVCAWHILKFVDMIQLG
jgi:pimeloyl-ACP methyl ester carboxylesterase